VRLKGWDRGTGACDIVTASASEICELKGVCLPRLPVDVDLAKIIDKASQSLLGIAALVILVLAGLAYFMYRHERNPIIRFSVFSMIFLAACFYLTAIFNVEKTIALNIKPVTYRGQPELPEPSASSGETPSQVKPRQGQEIKETKYCKADPATGVSYERQWSIRPSQYLTGKRRGGDSNTPGSEWINSWEAPGPVYEVSASPTGGWERVDLCSREGNNAKCEGWINGGDAAINMLVRWVQPCS